jgi:hypothetical protein
VGSIAVIDKVRSELPAAEVPASATVQGSGRFFSIEKAIVEVQALNIKK